MLLDHVLNSDHDALTHCGVYSGSEGTLFCVHCASERYNSAPNFRRLALLDGIRCIISVHGPQSLCNSNSIDACFPMLLNGIDSEDLGVVQAATDIILALKDELPDPMVVLASLIPSIVSLGLPRASGHLYVVGQLLTNASRDRALATTLGYTCFGRCDGRAQEQQRTLRGGDGSGGGTVAGSGGGGGGMGRGDEGELLRGFGAFLAAHALSSSCSDHIKSDVLYVALELLDCCTTACMGVGIAPQDPLMPPPPESDPFVSILLALPRLLARRSSCDEPLQLHSIAYLATAASYCRQRTETGVPGWLSNPAGVPDVLAALFEGAREIVPREMPVVGGGNGSSMKSSCGGGLCSTLKTLLMSSSYRVRSATARLITSLCSDDPCAENSAAVNETTTTGGSRKGPGVFFREILLAAGATDFLFEAIKSEREGTPRHYLQAAEAFASSPVEFFHPDNFSMKFAAPILLGASRVGVACWKESHDRAARDDADKYDEAVAFAVSCRLLLQALVTVPSSGGVVEELLATLAVSTQAGESKTRAIRLAADVLSLVASGDISLSKDRGNFLDAVGVLLDHLEEDLERAACSDSRLHQQRSTSIPGEGPASPSIGSADRPGVSLEWAGQEEDDADLILQCARVYESLLHMAEEWVSSQGTTVGGPSFQAAAGTVTSRFGRGGKGRDIRGEESVALADLVFGSYERTLPHQCNLIARSDDLAHDVVWLSCLGAAVDAASAVVFHVRRWEEAAAYGDDVGKGGRIGSWQRWYVRPSFIKAEELDHDPVGLAGGGVGGEMVCAGGQEGFIESGEVSTPASCLETILRVAVEADVVSWMLNLYARCAGNISAGGAETNSSQVSEGSSDGEDLCGGTTRALLAEVLQSFLYTQGWVNGLCTHWADRPSQKVGGGGGGSNIGETVRLMLQSWTASSVNGAREVPSSLDQHAMSRLGSKADNGSLCALAALLVSLSPSFLGVLHPHLGCRVESAVTLLRYVKNLPEAVFCLNLFSHVVLGGGDKTGRHDSGVRPSTLSGDLSTAVKDVLARFSVEEVALSVIPLSASALTFTLLAGCEAFIANWLVAAPLSRVKRALSEFGAFRLHQGAENDEAADAFAGGSDRQAMAGVLRAALSRWGKEVGNGLQHCSQSDAVIYRLTCVLLMAPDTFLSLAFDLDSQNKVPVDRQQRGRQELADTLGVIIPETLEGLSAALWPVVSRHGDRGNTTFRASKLACASHVSQLASAFLRARCTQGYYSTSVGSNMRASRGSCIEPPEISLARACGSLLQGMLDPRRGQGPSGGDISHGALLSAMNLLGALLVLVGGDSDLLQQAKRALASALRESHTALSQVLPAPTAVAVERLTGWLDHAPDVLAGFLHACVVWNATIESTSNVFDDDLAHCYLMPPFQVLQEVLSSGGSGKCFVEGGGGTSNNTSLSKTRASPAIPRRVVRRSLLQVLAMRCVESAAQRRLFNRQEVLALQLSLQGFACHGSTTLACVAHGAIQALWQSYAGVLQSADLVGQSWNPFMVECALENAVRSLSCVHESDADALFQPSGNDPDEFRVGAPVLVSAIGKLLLRSAGEKCPQLRSSEVLDGCNIQLLSATAAASVCQCAALVATNLRTALGDGMNQRKDRQDRPPRLGGESGSSSSSFEALREGGMGGDDATFHLSDALTQLVRVLVLIEPFLPQEGSVVGNETRKELVDALLPLHAAILDSCECGSRRHKLSGENVEQISMPLSCGAYHDCGENRGAFNSYEGVFFCKYDNWRSLAGALEPLSLAGLAGEVERLVELVQGRPGVESRMDDDESNGGQNDASNAMSVNVT